jgi:hypothetical protein
MYRTAFRRRDPVRAASRASSASHHRPLIQEKGIDETLVFLT